ncbi:MAG: TylF/MycF/NovP-related O-methyltransferase [Methylococcales bacterium]
MAFEPKNHTLQDKKQRELIERTFAESNLQTIEKLECFPRFTTRRAFSKFFARYEIFKKILDVPGAIVECGVLNGAGLFAHAHFSTMFEPYNYSRTIVGFDTFAGFPKVHDKDLIYGQSSHLQSGRLKGATLEEVLASVEAFDTNRPLSHIPKIDVVQGDLSVTAPKYIVEHPHLVVSLLYLDVDLYEPTLHSLKTFVPRMPKGAIIAFDELNSRDFPGETQAALEFFGMQNLRLHRFPFEPLISYCEI